MPTTYHPSAAINTSHTLPADGDLRVAASVNTPFQSIADTVEYNRLQHKNAIELAFPSVVAADEHQLARSIVAMVHGLAACNWTLQTTPNTNTVLGVDGNEYEIGYSGGNNKQAYLACTDQGDIWQSWQGVTAWGQVYGTTGVAKNAVKHFAGTAPIPWIAVEENGDIVTSSSDVGASGSWTDRTTNTSESLQDIEWSEALGLYILVAQDIGPSSQQIQTSPDGINWTVRTAPEATSAWSIDVSEDEVLIGADHQIWRSTDGTSWSISSSGISGASDRKLFVAYSSRVERWVMVDGSGNAAYSDDGGVTWTQAVVDAQVAFRGIDVDSQGLFVAVGERSGNGEIWVSPDGENWRLAFNVSTYAINAVGSSGWGIWVTGGENGEIRTSLKVPGW